MAELIFHALPASQSVRVQRMLAVLPQESLHSVLARGGLPVTAMALYVRVDGVAVDVQDWWDTELADSAVVDARPLLQGGGGEDGGSDPVRVILTIAVLAAAPYLAPALAGAGLGWAASTAGAALITAGATAAGMAAINAILPPQVPEITQRSLPSGQAAPSYAARSLGNSARPGQPITLLAGTHRVVPDLLCQPWRSTALGGKPAVFSVYSCAQNAVELTGWMLGDYEMRNYSVPVLTHRIRPLNGRSYAQVSDAWGHLPFFPDTLATLDVGETLTGRSEDGETAEAQSFEREIPVGTARVDLDMAVQLYKVTDAGEYARAELDIIVEYRKKGSATWLGAVEKYDYTNAAPPFGAWSRGKYGDQWPPQWVSTAIGSTKPGDSDYVLTPVEADGTHWRWLPWHMLHNSVGPVHPGPDSRQKTWALQGASPTVQRHTVQLHLSPRFAYEVRVRIAEQPEHKQGAARVAWERMHTVAADDGHARQQRRLGLCLIGSAETAQVQGQLSVVASGEMRSVFSDTDTSSSNPAEVFAALAVGKRAGGRRLWGGNLSAADLDISELSNWGTHCAAMGHSTHRVWSTREPLDAVLAQVAADGGAVMVWRGAKLSVIYPQADDPVVDHISMADMVASGFAVEYIRQPLPAVAVVKYFDAADNYRAAERTISIPGGDDALDPLELEVLGTTDATRVIERGRMMIARLFYDRRRTRITLDLAGFVYDRGDVLGVSHALCGWGYSGRLAVQRAGDSQWVALGRDIRLAGSGWVLYLSAPDGTRSEHSIITDGAKSSLWRVDVALPAGTLTRPEDYTWIIDKAGTAGRHARIIDIKPNGKQVAITLADECVEFYAQRTALTLPEPPVEVTAEPEDGVDGEALYAIDLQALGWPGTFSFCQVDGDGALQLDEFATTGEYSSDVLATGTTALHAPTLAAFGFSHYATLTARTGDTEAAVLAGDFEPLSGSAIVAAYIQLNIKVSRSSRA